MNVRTQYKDYRKFKDTTFDLDYCKLLPGTECSKGNYCNQCNVPIIAALKEHKRDEESMEIVKTLQNSSNEELKPCPFCGMTVHWDDLDGIIHDKVIANCIVDLVRPMDSNSNLPKEFWIKRWNWRAQE